MTTDQPVEFRLFGSVEADRAGTPIDLGHARQRCVLAVLLVDANTAVSVEELIDRVWAGQAPVRARESLQSYLTRLRRALPELSISRNGAGYVLAVDRHAVDLHRFRELAATAQKTGDPAAFEQALALWQGDPLAGLDVPWARALRTALAQERTAVELDLVDAQLRHGKHGDVLPTLTTRVETNPLDERLAGQYLLALYRAGRQADALSHYEHVRATLAEELGIDPGPDLRAIHQQILTGEAGPVPATPVAPVPRQLPAAPSSFSGRTRELDRLTAALDQAEPGRTVIISAVGGTGGIGKTWLAVHWAHQHTNRFPDGQLFVNLRGFDPSGKPTSPQDAIRGFLDALGVESSAIPVAFDAQTALYRSLVASKRMLIVLDNAADTAQVVPLLPGSPLCTVVVTSRDRMIGLVNTHGAHPLPLDALPEPEARALLAGRLGTTRLDREPDAVDILITCCAGLPLALSIVASRALEHPGFPLAEFAAELQQATDRLAALDEEPTLSVRSVLSWSYAALTEEQATVFGLLGLAPGPDISLLAAANLADLTDSRTRSVLRSLERVSLIQQHVPGRFRMHDLVRIYAAERAEVQTREPALRRIAAFYANAAARCEHFIGATSRQASPVEPPTTSRGPVDVNGKDAAMAWFDAEYSGLAATVRSLAELAPRDVWLIVYSMDYYNMLRGRLEEEVVGWLIALDCAAEFADDVTLSRSHRALGQGYQRLDRQQETLTHWDEALRLAQVAGHTESEAQTHYAFASAWEAWLDFRKGLTHGEQALTLFQSIDHKVGILRSLGLIGYFAGRLGKVEYGLATLEKALPLARSEGLVETAAETNYFIAQILRDTDRRPEAIKRYEQALALCIENQSLYGEVEVQTGLGDCYAEMGDPDRARSAWARAVELLDRQNRAARADTLREKLSKLDHEPEA
ncbi:MAG TPA: BTAD domain-containing putative transcriptional regulator [Pseudonocardiaceae bacterium]